MLMGAAGAIVPYFVLRWNETIAGFGAFGLGALGLMFGSLLGRSNGIVAAKCGGIGVAMRAWQYFWGASLLIAGLSFAGITLTVAMRGFHDLRVLFRRLRERKDEP